MLRSVYVLLLLCIAQSSLIRAAAPLESPPLLTARRLTASLAGAPVVAGDALFWLDRRAGGTIYGYRHGAAEPFVAAAVEPGSSVAYLAGDSYRLAWLDRSPTGQRIVVQQLATRQRTTIALPPDRAPADLALADGVLYVWDAAAGHRGIFAYDLASGHERLIQPLPEDVGYGRLSVAGGVLVWSQHRAQGAYLPPRATLHLSRLDGSAPARVVAEGQSWSGGLSGFDLSGEWLVWSFGLEQQVWLLNLRTGFRQQLPGHAATAPTIDGATVSWQEWDAPTRQSRLVLYQIGSGRRTTVSASGSALLDSQPLAGGRALLISADQRPTLRRELYLSALPTTDARIDLPAAAQAQLGPAAAASGGQIRVEGRQLVDGATQRRWTAEGVHLILPSRGINGSSFGAAALDDPHSAAERAVWLDRAQQIGVQTIRVYMDLPGDVRIAAPPRPEHIYGFARAELAPRGMRLALVIHNSGLFDDPDGQKMAWLRALLDCFGAAASCPAAAGQPDLTSLLAYINADNEINIHRQPLDDPIPGSPHCRPLDPSELMIAVDCFDHPDAEQRLRYIRAAINWVALVRQTLAQHPSGQRVLLTVGMSVDLDKDVLGDGQSAILNYFVRVPGADGAPLPSLTELIDFIAPHSYTAMPDWELIAPIERSQPLFAQPILLEEFGYPTDPIAQPDPSRPAEFKETSLNLQQRADGSLAIVANTDGLPPGEDVRKLCRYLPKLGVFGEQPKRCQPSAPYVVQANLEAIYDLRHFAGGVAFMLADSAEKDDGSKRCQDADERRQLSKNLFLGLFAIDARYHCGGTVNLGDGQIKNTGYRVCVAYRTGNTQLGNYRERVPECELDLPIAPAASPLSTPTQPAATTTMPSPTLQPPARPASMPAALPPSRVPLYLLGALTLAALLLGLRWLRRRL